MIISTAGSSISINALHASAAPFDIPEILIFVASTLLKVFNNFYGTTKESVIDYLEKGKNVIFDIDWQGPEQIFNRNLEDRVRILTE